jgi:hypothetical protein
MLRFLLIVVGVVVIGKLLLWAADRSWRLVSSLLRLAVGFAAVLMAFVGYTFLVNDEGGPVSFLVIGAVLTALAAHLVWQLVAGRSRLPSRARSFDSAPATVPSTLEKDEWAPFLRSLGWLRRQRAMRCRTRIRQFLDAAGEGDMGFHHRELVIALERRVPELLDAWERSDARGTAIERRRYTDRTLNILEALAAEADRSGIDLRQDEDRRFDTLERYFSHFSARGRRPD